MKALVTGAGGFVGSTLIEELDTLGFEVFALLRKNSGNPCLEGLKYQTIEGDLNDPISLKQAVRGMDYIFHLAGATQAKNEPEYMEMNAKATARLAQAVCFAQPSLTRFVYVSSLSAAGPAESLKNPRTESERETPVSAYGRSKLQAERELLKYRDFFPISIVRPPLVYGPKDRSSLLMIQTVARNVMPILQGKGQGGHKYFCLIHAKDLSRGLVQAAVAPVDKVPSGEIFFLAGDGVYSYQECLMQIAEKLNCDPLRLKIPHFFVRTAAQGLSGLRRLTRGTLLPHADKVDDLVHDFWICSNRKAKERLGFTPEFDLSTGLTQSIEWYKKQGCL